MDTPDKNRIAAVSLCNFEDSPVFKYINDLSPIEPVKSGHTDHILNSLALASPSSLFSSPQVYSNRESRFSIKRHQSPDLSNSGCLVGGTVNDSRDVPETVKPSSLSDEQLKFITPKQLDKDAETKPFMEQFGLASTLAKALKNVSDVCDIQMISCDKISAESENGTARVGSVIKFNEQSRDPLKFEADFQPISQTEKNEVDDGSGAVELTSDVASVLDIEIPDQKIADPGANSLASSPQHLPLDSHNLESVDPGGSLSCSVQSVTGALDITLTGSCEVNTNYPNAKTGGKEERCLQPTRKQRSVRRRCLIFDAAGSCKKKPLRDSTNNSPTALPSSNKVLSPKRQLVPIKDTDNALCMPRTIGLHLNGLVNSSSKGIKLISKAGHILSHGPTFFPQNLDEELSTPVSTERDLVCCENEVTQEAPEISIDGDCLESDTLTGKRHWSEELSESGSCKRCKCRRSKCLKLYCDCFAAGLYCIEPCSCQDCFNKPMHEDIVMETRRQIEARNPLAFAPKVVATIDSSSDFGDDKNATPASARHKRGCNCKKSNCLKKYCECFLMGVGCSPSCRCIGCKNSFGHKDEAEAVMINEEERDQDEKINNASSGSNTHDNDSDIDMVNGNGTPFLEPLLRSRNQEASIKPNTLPKLESHLQMIPEEEETPEITESNRILFLRSIPPFPSLKSP